MEVDELDLMGNLDKHDPDDVMIHTDIVMEGERDQHDTFKHDDLYEVFPDDEMEANLISPHPSSTTHHNQTDDVDILGEIEELDGQHFEVLDTVDSTVEDRAPIIKPSGDKPDETDNVDKVSQESPIDDQSPVDDDKTKKSHPSTSSSNDSAEGILL
jgi:hypothetical protein